MAAYQAALPELAARGISVWAASTEPREGSAALVERLSLTLPFGHSLPMVDTAERLGVFYEDRRQILHAASFVFSRAGQIDLAVTSTGAVGRLMPDELLRLVDFWHRS